MAKKTVVVADDQPGIRRLLSEVLNSDEYALLEAASGEEAMEMIRERPVDLVFLDVRMPRLDGVETLRKIMQLHAHPPVIVITGQGSPDLAKRVKKLGAATYLEKPFDIKLILKLIQQYT
ncbi:MAG: response regulator [Eubacteriales bacterium]|nr:response regulator [Eubacteriales bacterium]MDD4769172.1 response regulator [Eubacteriales bacterium]